MALRVEQLESRDVLMAGMVGDTLVVMPDPTGYFHNAGPYVVQVAEEYTPWGHVAMVIEDIGAIEHGVVFASERHPQARIWVFPFLRIKQLDIIGSASHRNFLQNLTNLDCVMVGGRGHDEFQVGHGHTFIDPRGGRDDVYLHPGEGTCIVAGRGDDVWLPGGVSVFAPGDRLHQQ